MNHLAQIEDDLRNLAAEAGRKYPEVKDSTERALSSLKMIREMYVSMRRSEASSKEVKFPQSSDISAPYILACNYADGSVKLISMALNGMQMLINYDVVPASDVKNILRVLCIQASSGKADHKLKLLQILLHLVNALSKNAANSQYLTEATVCSFLTLALQLCDGRSNASVSSTALATARQVLAVVLDGTTNIYFGSTSINSASGLQPQQTSGNSGIFSCAPMVLESTPDQSSSSFTVASLLLIRDVSLFMQGHQGEWLRGVTVPQSFALDLMYDAISGWKHLFLVVPQFKALLKESICSAIKPLLQFLQEDFIETANKNGLAASAALTSRVIRIVRCIMINYVVPELTGEINLLSTLLVHAMQPTRDGGESLRSLDSSVERGNKGTRERDGHKVGSVFEDASSLIQGGASGFMARLNIAGNRSSQFSGSRIGASVGAGANSLRLGSPNLLTLSTSRFVYGHNHSQGGETTQIPAHPAGACLEALLSLFLSEVPTNLTTSELGCHSLASLLTTTIISVSSLLVGGLTIEGNAKDLEASARGSQIITLIEGILTGAESDVQYVVKSVHEHLISSMSICSSEVLVLGAVLLQVTTRLLLKLALHTQQASDDTPSPSVSDRSKRRQSDMLYHNSIISSDDSVSQPATNLRITLCQVCDSVYDNVQDACVVILFSVDNPGVVRRTLGILSELALVAGLLGLTRPCEVVISTLCKFATPKWLVHELQHSSNDSSISSPETLRWINFQACMRLLQDVHVLGDNISDWDTIVDTFEQLVKLNFSSPHSPTSSSKGSSGISDEVSVVELDKMYSAIMRFKSYSIFLSDDSLVKLMTSLLQLSTNHLTVVGGSCGTVYGRKRILMSSTAGGDTQSSISKERGIVSLSYMQTGLTDGSIPFSLQAAIEIAKYNRHRIACVWQMVTSHLRMAATLNSSVVRTASVAATQDIILCVLEFVGKVPHDPLLDFHIIEDDSFLQLFPPSTPSSSPPNFSSKVCLSDDVILSHLMPSFETTFSPRRHHADLFTKRNGSKLPTAILLHLSQGDLFSGLNLLSNTQFDDVRNDVIIGLLRIIQGNGQTIDEFGWVSVLELLISVPTSMTTPKIAPALERENDDDENLEQVRAWPRTSLTTAFNCIKLIVDDFIDMMPLEAVKLVIVCLYNFAAQSFDVNMSLVAIEMLWKVGDMSMSRSPASSNVEEHTTNVLDVMMQRLLILSTDSRPEVRNCGMNTLFSAMTGNATLMAPQSWKEVFEDVIFPLFERAEARSNRAVVNKEAVQAIDLKKGVTMAVHHSRDTAAKQWSETRSLALRGLSRVIKTCTKLLLKEPWFKDAFLHSIDICKDAVLHGSGDEEVASAAIDVLFNMMKIVSTSSQVTNLKAGFESSAQNQDNQELILIENAREDLWCCSWQAVRDIARFDCFSQELPLHICQQLASLYSHSVDGEFRYSDNVRGLLEMVVLVSRPRLDLMNTSTSTPSHNRVAEVRIHQAIMSLLKCIKHSDMMSAGLLASVLSEIAFAIMAAETTSFSDDQNVIYLAPCPEKLRLEAGEYLLSLLAPRIEEVDAMNSKSNSTASTFLPKGSFGTLLDIIFRRFVADICEPSLIQNEFVIGGKKHTCTAIDALKKQGLVDNQKPSVIPKRSGMGEFFSSIGKMLSSPDSRPHDSGLQASSLLGSLHNLKHLKKIPLAASSLDQKSNCSLLLEIRILTEALKAESRDNATTNLTGCSKVSTLSSMTWTNLTCAVSCMLSPWRDAMLQECNPKYIIDCSVAVNDFLSNVFHLQLISRMPTKCALSLLEASLSATSLVIATIAVFCNSDVFLFHMNVIQSLVKHLSQLVESSDLPQIIRKSSLRIMMIIFRDLTVNTILSGDTKTTYPLSLHDACSGILLSLLNLNTAWCLLPDGYSVTEKMSNVEDLLSFWIACTLPISDIQNLDAKDDAELSISNKQTHSEPPPSVDRSLHTKAHLLMIITLAMRVASSSLCSETLREVAIRVIDTVDITALVSSYTNLLQLSERLASENQKLKELFRVDAASLPF